jgi:hypothetical protein
MESIGADRHRFPQVHAVARQRFARRGRHARRAGAEAAEPPPREDDLAAARIDRRLLGAVPLRRDAARSARRAAVARHVEHVEVAHRDGRVLREEWEPGAGEAQRALADPAGIEVVEAPEARGTIAERRGAGERPEARAVDAHDPDAPRAVGTSGGRERHAPCIEGHRGIGDVEERVARDQLAQPAVGLAHEQTSTGGERAALRAETRDEARIARRGA